MITVAWFSSIHEKFTNWWRIRELTYLSNPSRSLVLTSLYLVGKILDRQTIDHWMGCPLNAFFYQLVEFPHIQVSLFWTPCLWTSRTSKRKNKMTSFIWTKTTCLGEGWVEPSMKTSESKFYFLVFTVYIYI